MGLIPLDCQCITTTARRPKILRENHDTARNFNYLDDACNLLGLGCVPCFHLRAKARWMGDDGGQHAWAAYVYRVLGTAAGLFWRIDARQWFADQLKLCGLF